MRTKSEIDLKNYTTKCSADLLINNRIINELLIKNKLVEPKNDFFNTTCAEIDV